jgi:translation elongation factor P/translation initiation factor 5A
MIKLKYLITEAETTARNLKRGYSVFFADQGPFIVTDINLDPTHKNKAVVRLEMPNDSSKWARVNVDPDVTPFTVVSKNIRY